MGKATQVREMIQSPTPEQQAQDIFERDFVMHVETTTKAQAYRRRQSRSAFERLCERGAITDEHLKSIREIAVYLEHSRRSLATKGASLEARVDCSKSATHAMHESLRMVRLERAFVVWFINLPLPRQMFLDMIYQDGQLAQIARVYRKSWVKARAMLIEELDRWPTILAAAVKGITHEDLLIQHARLSV